MMQTEGTVPDGQTAAVFLADLRGGFDKSGMVERGVANKNSVVL